MKVLRTLNEMMAAVAQANSGGDEATRIDRLVELAYRPAVENWAKTDPFSQQYRAEVLSIYALISGRKNYDASADEQAPYLDKTSIQAPGVYDSGSTAVLGDYLMSVGHVLRVLDAKPGMKVLEYGPGEGAIALEAAKAGCHVSVVDIEKRYLDRIQWRASRDDITIRTCLGEFGVDPGGPFDRIYFFEAFHHALDHIALLPRLGKMLTADGRLVFAGEPIIGSHNEHWRPSLPYPWGLRLDGLSFRAIQTYGWMELGFDEGYFVELLLRAGFKVDFVNCASTQRGTCYVARSFGDTLEMGDRFMIATSSGHGDWHDGEGSHRWTAKERASLPLPPSSSIEIVFSNLLSVHKSVHFSTLQSNRSVQVPPHTKTSVTLRGGAGLVIAAELTYLPDIIPGTLDTRRVGIAIERVRLIGDSAFLEIRN